MSQLSEAQLSVTELKKKEHELRTQVHTFSSSSAKEAEQIEAARARLIGQSTFCL